jgi:hypothetical protein
MSLASVSGSTGPSTAERIRSACVRAGSALLALEGVEPESTPVHHLMADGSFAVTVPTNSASAGRVLGAGITGVQAVLELTDYSPLPLREPVRSLVWIRGGLQRVPESAVRATLDLIAAEDPNPVLLQVSSELTLLRLEVESVVVADATGAESIGVGALLEARPDPFCVMETCWLRHIDSDHRDVIDRLASIARGAAARPDPPTRTGPVRSPAPRRRRRRRSRRAVAVRQAGRRRDRTQPGHPYPDGLPVRERSARAAVLTAAQLP